MSPWPVCLIIPFTVIFIHYYNIIIRFVNRFAFIDATVSYQLSKTISRNAYNIHNIVLRFRTFQCAYYWHAATGKYRSTTRKLFFFFLSISRLHPNVVMVIEGLNYESITRNRVFWTYFIWSFNVWRLRRYNTTTEGRGTELYNIGNK